jgi:formylglycine-generating enzyme required for sulfatase activity
MSFLDEWKEKAWQQAARIIPNLVREGSQFIYAGLSFAALVPLLDALRADPLSAGIALGSLTVTMGRSLLADQVKQAANRPPEIAAQDIANQTDHNPELVKELDTVLDKLEMIRAVESHLSKEDKAWFLQTLNEDAKRVGSTITIKVYSHDEIKDNIIINGKFLGNIYKIYKKPSGEKELDNKEFKRVLGEYLRWVYNAYSQARLYGLESLRTTRGPAVRRLKDVFVPISLCRYNPPSRRELQEVEKAGEDLFTRSLAFAKLMELKQEEGEEIILTNLLTIQDRLAIIGGAGCGKSTLLAYLAAVLAQSAREELPSLFTLPLGNHALIPLLVPLRYYPEYLAKCLKNADRSEEHSHLGTLAEFIPWYFCGRNPTLGSSKDFFRRLLLGGGCLVMLDGLDEVVNQEERGYVRQQIENLLNDTYPGNRVIVTARESGYKENAIFGDDFVRLDVKRLNNDQLMALVKNWCVQLYPGEVDTRLDELMDAINQINASYENRNLAPLISTPLMTTMVVSVKWGETELPRERARLYEAAVRVILQAQYMPEDYSRTELVDWGGAWDEQREWLSKLALSMHKGGRAGAVISEDGVKLGLRNAGVVTKAGNKFIHAVRQRGGLFEERGEIFQFVHLTFQEFLAARIIAKRRGDLLKILKKYLSDSWWREVFLLIYGFALEDYVPFARRYLKWLSNIKGEDTDILSGLELAAAALLEIDKPEPLVAKTQANNLMDFLFNLEHPCRVPAIQRCNASITLARLGDPRFHADFWFLPNDDLLGFIEVPAGPFWMGSDPKIDKYHLDNEKPFHEVDLSTFYIARYPVTVAQFRAFAEESKSQPGNLDNLNGIPNHPIVNVTWYSAIDYCNWLTENLRKRSDIPGKLAELIQRGGSVMLPSEAEWEKAARGCDGRIYPWEGNFDTEKVNSEETRIGWTSSVGCFPGGSSIHGTVDMVGNVWEWTRSLYGRYPYPQQGIERQRREDLMIGENVSRVLRGGSYQLNEWDVRCAYRYRDVPNGFLRSFGFRVAIILK